MSTEVLAEATPAQAPAVQQLQTVGKRKNGKNWHPSKKAFRPTAGLTAYDKRKAQDSEKKIIKAREQEMRDGKEDERNRRIQAIKDRRKAKEEKDRFALMKAKMHAKSVERRKRREKRNKLLKS